MKRSNAKLYFLILGVSFLVTISCMVAMTHSSMRVIYFGIRHDLSMLSLTSQISSLLQKLVCGSILLTAGIFCIYLYLQTYESDHFLQISTIFFLSAGLIMSLQDYKVLFYATSQDRFLFNLCADIFLLLFSGIVLCDRTELDSPTAELLIHALLIGVHLLLCAVRLVTRTMPFLSVLRLYALGVCAYSALLFAVSRKPWSLISLLPLDAILLIISTLKFSSLSDHYENYLRFIPYAIIVYAMLLFNARYQLHRVAVLLGRIGKRRLQEDEDYRRVTIHTIFLYCSKSLNRLNAIAHQMQENRSGQLAYAAVEIQREVHELYTSILSAQQHIRVRDAMLSPDMNRLSLHVLFSYISEELERVMPYAPKLEIACGEDWSVRGDPILLIRANCSVLSTLQEFGQLVRLKVVANEQGTSIAVQFFAEFDAISDLRARRLMRRFRRVNAIHRAVPDDELALTIAKAILVAHNAQLSLHRAGPNRIALSYLLPKWDAAPSRTGNPLPQENGADNPSIQGQPVRVAMLSTSEHQIAFTRSCLSGPAFVLQAFTDASTFLDHIERNRVNVVIVGALYVQTDLTRLCRTIRNRFAIGLLPIILYRHNDFEPVESACRAFINDFLSDPCDNDEVRQRVLSLAMMQRSTEELRIARLEFLQSQMDPHFIFNAINAIMPLCLRDPQQAYALLGNFSDYLHGNLFPKESNRPIHIYEELDLIRAYLALEDARTPGLIEYEIAEEYDESLTIFPLLIEPLVENCVKHGLQRNGQTPPAVLHIHVSIVQQGDALHVVVQDDGVGFDPKRPAPSASPAGKVYRSIGIDNLKKRLLLYYQSNLVVNSRPGAGTRVSFTIPAVRGPALR